MTDETSLAFEPLTARAVATAGDTVPDRISVRDFVKSVEIGAFQSERGVTQRIRFNVVLEVSHSTAAFDDDVDKVMSYDTIVEAIEAQLAAERINLLETLAERVAERCLADPRAIRIFVRIEKLDRIPGALGVEILRHRLDPEESAVLRPVPRPLEMAGQALAPHVIFLPNAVLESDALDDWLDVIAALKTPAIITLEMFPLAMPTDHKWARRRIGLLAIEQNAWRLAARDDRCVVVATRTELEHAAKQGNLSVWAPSKIVLDATDRPSETAETPAALAAWFRHEIGGADLTVIGTAGPEGALSVTSPAELAQRLDG